MNRVCFFGIYLFFCVYALPSAAGHESLSEWWQKKVYVGDKEQWLRGGFVLPYYFNQHTKHRYYILGRETGGKDRNMFGAFGGRRDLGEDHPVVTAAREFYEEVNLGRNRMGGWSQKRVQGYIDLASGNTEAIVASVTRNRKIRSAFYITHFGEYNACKVLKNFNRRYNEDKEMDQLAEVRHDRLVDAIKDAQQNKPINVEARVWVNGKKRAQNEIIRLRPLMDNLKHYFSGDHGSCGLDKRIHFYG